MKHTILTFTLLLLLSVTEVTATPPLSYFESTDNFDPVIPTPSQFLGYEIGSRITEHSRINAYLEKLASVSDKTSLIEIGRTHENRKMYILIVSSPKNIINLQTIKVERKKARSAINPGTPLIVFLGNTVHGNEISSSEAAMLAAYYLVASRSTKVNHQLEEGIYFIEPVRNPDGQERFASWINSNVSINVYNTSPFDREHTEAWPGSRGNHYWFDLNRDWINMIHPESRARVALYQDWIPHVQADHHEMGTNNTFFFEPTDPDGNESKLIPSSNYKLNGLFAGYFAKALNKIGAFYYTKESFDNKNPNFGSTYPDYNGGLGILFEQASSRGLRQQSENGILTLPYTIRNQLVTTLATIEAAVDHKSDLFALQQEFFTPPVVKKGEVTYYIIGDKYDRSRLLRFIKLLLDHRLEVYENPNDLSIDSTHFEKGKSYLIPVSQANSALTKIIFDEHKQYDGVEKLSYGAGFSVALSTGLKYGKSNLQSRGRRVETIPSVDLPTLQQSDYAYIVDFRDSNSQQLLFRLLDNDLLVKAATKPFSIQTTVGLHEFSYGSLLIPVQSQKITSTELHQLLKLIGKEEQVAIIPVSGGLSISGVDLGSNSFRNIEKPKVLLLTGGDISSTEAGEVWHLFDQQLKYPLTRVNDVQFRRVPIYEYNRIVLVSGSYKFLDKQSLEELQSWVKNGGTLITLNEGTRWAVSNQFTGIQLKTDKTDAPQGNTHTYRKLPTSVFQTRINMKHPVAYGLTSDKLPVIRENSVCIVPGSATSVSIYTNSPLLNGYSSTEFQELLEGSTSIAVFKLGRGSLIHFAENPLFRGNWDGTTRTFINSIVVGNFPHEFSKLIY